MPRCNKKPDIHFFTIVLNGKPFIEYHINVFRQLPFKWHWHIIEGVAELKNDTAWSLGNGGRISNDLHNNGLSNDGTTAYLDSIENQFTENITIYRKSGGSFWNGKLEMVNEPLPNINEECILWEIDADELWTAEQINQVRQIFIDRPEMNAAYYLCNFFVGEELITTTIDTYGNNTAYEWLRTWRFKPGDKWISHEPPRLCRMDAQGRWHNLADGNYFDHPFTSGRNLIFQHFAYAAPAQLLFKEKYYGYKNALAQWVELQQNKEYPILLKNYFGWVNDETLVDNVFNRDVKPIAVNVNGQWKFRYAESPGSAVKKILFIRTDSIGDNVLASSMLGPLKSNYPEAEITLLCQNHIVELYENCPYVESVIGIDKGRIYVDENYRNSIIEQLHRRNFDLAINSVYSSEKITDILTMATAAKKIIRIDGNEVNSSPEWIAEARRLASGGIETGTGWRNELNRYKKFLEGIGIASADLKPEVWPSGADEIFARKFFDDQNLDPGKTIVLFAGALNDHRFYYDYGKAISEICRDRGYSVVAVGSEKDFSINQANLDDIDARTINLSGKTTLLQTAAIIKMCALAVGAETGSAHISCAVGTPNVIAIGGGHFGRFMPYSNLTSLVLLPMDCYGCNWICGELAYKCVTHIPVEIISYAVEETLDAASENVRIFTPAGENPGIIKELLDCNNFEFIRGKNLSVSDAEEAIECGEYMRAAEILGRILKRDPVNIDALIDLAVVNSVTGNNISSVKLLKAVLQIEPGNRIAKNNLEIITMNNVEENVDEF